MKSKHAIKNNERDALFPKKKIPIIALMESHLNVFMKRNLKNIYESYLTKVKYLRIVTLKRTLSVYAISRISFCIEHYAIEGKKQQKYVFYFKISLMW